MAWTSILSALVFVGITALLVMIEKWSLMKAVGIVMIVAIIFIIILVALLYVLTPTDERSGVLQVIKTAFCKGWKSAMKTLWFR